MAELPRFCGLRSPVGSSGLCSGRLLGRATTGQLITGDTGWGMADDTHCLGSAWLCAGWGGMEKVGPHELGYCPTLQEVEAAGCCRCFRTHSILNLSRLPLCSRGVTHLRSLLGILNLLCVSDAKLAFLWATDDLMFSKILSADYARSPRMEM